MAFDFATLTASKTTPGSIAFWSQHASIDAVGTLIQAQAWIYERLRAREMRASTTVSVAAGAYVAPLPVAVDPPVNSFLVPVAMTWRGDSDQMDYVHENMLGRFINQGDTAPQAGRPQRYAIFDEQFQFDVSLSENLVADLIFYKRLPDLNATTYKTNFVTVRFPLLLRRICTALGYEDRKRDATQMYQLAEQSVAEANIAEDLGRMGQVLR